MNCSDARAVKQAQTAMASLTSGNSRIESGQDSASEAGWEKRFAIFTDSNDAHWRFCFKQNFLSEKWRRRLARFEPPASPDFAILFRRGLSGRECDEIDTCVHQCQVLIL